jgi:Fe2+ transport system protein FeoA
VLTAHKTDPLTVLVPTTMTLDELTQGQTAAISASLDDMDSLTTLRLGLIPGQAFTLLAKVPGGPLVIQQGQIELALGRDLCQRIQVELLPKAC